MLNTLCNNFIKSSTPENALDLIRYLRRNNMFHLGTNFGKYFNTLFPFSYEIKEEYGICLYYIKSYCLSYDIFNESLNFKGLDEITSKRLLFNQHFNIDHVAERYTYYNSELINKILTRNKKDIKLVTFTITTCKRLDLFQKTLNSVINCFDTDMIDEWLCIDDNSSEDDRKKMMDLYPFFSFIFKDIRDKGHSKSMNILQKYVKTPYIFHVEDDWKFICKRNYIAECLDILNSNKNLGQCLINKNYSEVEKDVDIKGGEYNSSVNGLRYYVHEFATNDEQRIKWINKHGNGLSSNYWPHFSLRPSLIRKEVFDKIGDFNDESNHFEIDYASRYVNNGYLSAFLEGIYSIHIGRLTTERNDVSKINAYTLNNESQFIKTPVQKTIEIDFNDIDIKLKTYVLNLDRRPDRWDNFKKNSKSIDYLKYERFSAVDGSKLKSTVQLQRIFEGNDYNMMVGAVGCAMSYFKMFTELIYSDYEAYLILEDDIQFTSHFDIKFYSICKQLKNTDWDIAFIGHHIRNLNDPKYNIEQIFHIKKYDTETSFLNSLGGTIGFMITKNGARKFLDFVNENKLINCIDTTLQKSANYLNVYYAIPNLVNSECFRHDSEKVIDTDIQFDKSSLTRNLYDKIQDELAFFKEIDVQIDILEEDEILLKLNNKNSFNALCVSNNINNLIEICKNNNIKHYTYENKVIFITNMSRYYHIFKKNDIYNVDDCLVYN